MNSKKFLPLLPAVFLLCVALLIGYTLGSRHVRGLSVTSAHVAPTTAAAVPEPTAPPPTESCFPLDLNTATAEELAMLPGIGEVLAGNIIQYRQAHGAFVDPIQLTDVPGIGTKKYEAAAPYVTVTKEDTHENSGS